MEDGLPSRKGTTCSTRDEGRRDICRSGGYGRESKMLAECSKEDREARVGGGGGEGGVVSSEAEGRRR